MKTILNDDDLRRAVAALPHDRQRPLGARFIEHVLDVARDPRIAFVLEAAKASPVSDEVLENAYHIAKKVVIGTYVQCGHQLDLMGLAEHHAALAALVCLSSAEEFQEEEHPACKAAYFCRQARSFEAMARGEEVMPRESAEAEAQYRIMERFLAESLPA